MRHLPSNTKIILKSKVRSFERKKKKTPIKIEIEEVEQKTIEEERMRNKKTPCSFLKQRQK